MKSIEEKAKEYANRIADGTSEVWHFMDEVYTELKDAYLAGVTEVLAGQWRRVEDELPELRQRVLICLKERNATRNSIVISKRIPFASDNPDNLKWEWSNTREEDVIAWMPLPEPPKDESHV